MPGESLHFEPLDRCVLPVYLHSPSASCQVAKESGYAFQGVGHGKRSTQSVFKDFVILNIPRQRVVQTDLVEITREPWEPFQLMSLTSGQELMRRLRLLEFDRV